MGHPPFDNEASREPLRAILNEIPAVDIPAARLRGRPHIPLAKLVDPTSLARLIAVLDRVVDETRPTAAKALSTIDGAASGSRSPSPRGEREL